MTPLLTVPEAADHLRFSVRTVRQLIADGLLPVVRIGVRVRIRPTDLCRFVEDRLSARAERDPSDDPSDISGSRALAISSALLADAAESDRQDAKGQK
jgi:excisionase family DNA binding protein